MPKDLTAGWCIIQRVGELSLPRAVHKRRPAGQSRTKGNKDTCSHLRSVVPPVRHLDDFHSLRRHESTSHYGAVKWERESRYCQPQVWSHDTQEHVQDGGLICRKAWPPISCAAGHTISALQLSAVYAFSATPGHALPLPVTFAQSRTCQPVSYVCSIGSGGTGWSTTKRAELLQV